jgi:hypothetical protein
MQIKHTFPELGFIEVSLHNESHRIYTALEKIKNSGSAHLDKIDQLGELRQVLHCGHHSRYEYLIFQLYLIQFFKEESKAHGLATRIKLDENLEISSCEELLKSWAILFENGHLLGTFEAERNWLYQICKRNNLREWFFTLIDDDRVREYAKHILEDEDLFSFYQLLSWIFIKRALREAKIDKEKHTFSLALSVLSSFFQEAIQGTSLYRSQLAFKRIRRLAHLYMDVMRLPASIRFNPPIILQDIKINASLYLDDFEEQYHRLADALHELLMEQLYASREAARFKLERMITLKEYFDHKIMTPGQSQITSAKELEAQLQGAKDHALTGMKCNLTRWIPYIRLHFKANEYFSPDRAQIFSDENKIRSTLKSSHWEVFITPYDTELGNGIILDVYENNENNEEQEGFLISALLSYISSRYSDWEDIKGLYDDLCDKHLVKVFEVCLSRYLSGTFNLRTVHATSQHETSATLLLSRKERTGWSRGISWRLKKSTLSKDRKWESECLRREVRNAAKGKILVCNCNTIVEDENNLPIAEFDGVFFRIYGANVELGLVEAKSGRRAGRNEAVKELSAKLHKLGASEREAQRLVRGERKYAVALIPLKRGRKWVKRC